MLAGRFVRRAERFVQTAGTRSYEPPRTLFSRKHLRAKTTSIAYGMPADFLTNLQTDSDAFEAALGTTGTATDSHVEINETIHNEMIIVRALNGIVKNVFGNGCRQTRRADFGFAHRKNSAKKSRNRAEKQIGDCEKLTS